MQPMVKSSGDISIPGHSRSSTSHRSLGRNGYAERLIGSLPRECVDHVVVFGGRHLLRLLLSYMSHYEGVRTRLSLNKNINALL